MKKNSKLIPKGDYCYVTIKVEKNKDSSKPPKLTLQGICPYYRVIKSRPERLRGFCDYLEKGDLELAKERVKHNWGMIKHREGKQQKRDMTKKEKEMFAKSGSMSLLWDQCKECGMNLGK